MKKLQWLDAAAARLLHQSGTNTYRVATNAAMWIERFGSFFRVSVPDGSEDRSALLADLKAWVSSLDAEMVPEQPRFFWRLLAADARNQRGAVELNINGSERNEPSAKQGAVVQELGLAYGIDLAGYSAGLFLDQRENRQALMGLVREGRTERILNCFAYTGAFSVSAAAAGAKSTTSIDLSKAAILRARDNFLRNDLALQGNGETRHHFVNDDVFGALSFFTRKNIRFDCIILDPPTFSRGKARKIWRAESDYRELIADALPVCKPGARLLLSTNATTLSPSDLVDAMRDAAGKRTVEFMEAPVQADFPPGSGGCSSTVWAQLA